MVKVNKFISRLLLAIASLLIIFIFFSIFQFISHLIVTGEFGNLKSINNELYNILIHFNLAENSFLIFTLSLFVVIIIHFLIFSRNLRIKKIYIYKYIHRLITDTVLKIIIIFSANIFAFLISFTYYTPLDFGNRLRYLYRMEALLTVNADYSINHPFIAFGLTIIALLFLLALNRYIKFKWSIKPRKSEFIIKEES